MKLVQWLYHNMCESTDAPEEVEELAVGQAAGYGHFDTVQWLHAQLTAELTEGERPGYNVLWATMEGRLDMVKWFLENGEQPDDSPYILDNAAVSDNLELLDWLHEQNAFTCSTYAMDRAAMRNHLHVVEWFHENRNEGCTTHAMDAATRNDHLAVVRWLHENRTE